MLPSKNKNKNFVNLLNTTFLASTYLDKSIGISKRAGQKRTVDKNSPRKNHTDIIFNYVTDGPRSENEVEWVEHHGPEYPVHSG